MSGDSGCVDPDSPHHLDITFENDTVIVGDCTLCGAHVEADKQEPGYG